MITFSLAYTKKAQLCTKQLGTYHKCMEVCRQHAETIRDYGLGDTSKLLLKI